MVEVGRALQERKYSEHLRPRRARLRAGTPWPWPEEAVFMLRKKGKMLT